MPFNSIQRLPEAVQTHLPTHAQEIYKEAFNHAFQEYADPSKRQDESSREETAHKVAWAAVKEKYKKGPTGRWIKK